MTISRRRFLGFLGGGAAVAAGAGAGLSAVAQPSSADPLATTYRFDGVHQAGIVTPAQDRLHFAAFDLITDRREDLVELMKVWTNAARQMCAGEEAGVNGAVGGPPSAPPDDTGEAIGLPPSGLTITIGFGPDIFTKDGVDRFGVAAKRPAALVPLPHFAGDALDPSISGGDLAIQACANDPQVAVHAVRNLARLAHGTATVRWSQLGFGRTSSTSTTQEAPRNLFGFKDGTANLKVEDSTSLDQHLWVSSSDDENPGAWMAGGTYMVARRIRMQIETWDRSSLTEQETIIGRDKGEGAPKGASKEFDAVDLSKRSPAGQPAIATDAHVRLAHPDSNGGAHMLRRGYSFVDGSDGLGRLDAGLFFISYQRDVKQFVAVQNNLARNDALNEYIRHTGSAVFACPPGVQGEGDYWGRSLLA